MIIIRKILKLILLPVSLLLFLIKWAIELAVRMTSALVGILIVRQSFRKPPAMQVDHSCFSFK